MPDTISPDRPPLMVPHPERIDTAADAPPSLYLLPPACQPARPTRHLPERILVAVHEACDLGALDIAADLLRILEVVVTGMQQSSPTARRRSMEGVVAAHDRIWHLRNERRLILDDPFAALR